MKEKPKIWFLTTIKETNQIGVPKLRMLPNQLVPGLDGELEESDVNLDTQSLAAPRNENPIGTIFTSDNVSKRLSFNGRIELYTVGVEGHLEVLNEETRPLYKQYLKDNEVLHRD